MSIWPLALHGGVVCLSDVDMTNEVTTVKVSTLTVSAADNLPLFR
ncbi:hypothetical protein [Staphylococcus haemolyticus]|nr:hypothetical protein [Staphylococcus haemolyticus]